MTGRSGAMKHSHSKRMTLVVIVLVLLCGGSNAQEFDRSVRTSENFEPAIPHPQQLQDAEAKFAALKAKTGKHPNIVWIVVDDMGFGDPGCYGGGELVGAATPSIDELAAGGLRLTSCYAQQTCTPTRSAILTGRLPVRTGLTRPILAGDKITKNPWADEISLPKLLGTAGYRTLLTGKWHVGEAEGMRPHDIGFDEFYGYYPAQKEISQRYDERRFPDLVLDEERLEAFDKVGPTSHLIHGFKGGKTNEVGQIKSLDDMSRADQVLVDFTVAKIKEMAANEQPFFIEHCFMKVHCDNFAHPDFKGKSSGKYAYKDAVVEVDAHVGTIIKALETAGVLDNTFVFFTSDNGPQMDAWPDAGYSPFRGAKGTTFEAGVRVPGIAYWKGMIQAGRTSDGLFDLMDLFGTSLKLAGVDRSSLPADRYYDFIDQTSFLLNAKGDSNREAVFFWWGKELMACRMHQYKTHIKVVLPQTTHLHIDMATVHDVGLAPWLFNLHIDPKEQTPVGHRRNAWLATLASKLKRHGGTLKKFPPKDIGL